MTDVDKLVEEARSYAAEIRDFMDAESDALPTLDNIADLFDRLSATLTEVLRERDALRERFDMRAFLQAQREWSEATFGPGPRVKGNLDHIRKEMTEIEANPEDVTEWLDVATLALDGAWRAGFSPDDIIAAWVAKMERNRARQWPDWRTVSTDRAIEHLPSPHGASQ